ncbi:MAG TPA: MFS transporter [Propionibacteriaceae bacterium]|nr:MFS transporter [Propionibacteriaceae bacterium]
MLPHVLRWLIGLATSLIGNHIYLVTLAWVAVQTTTPVNVGLILVAGAIPQAALLLVGGVLVDRIGPKPTIIASDLLRTLIMIVFAIVVAGGDVSPLLLGALAVLFGLVDGFFLPAINTAPRYLVRREGITRVVAAKTIVARGAEFVGAPLGSLLLVVASAVAAFLVNAWLFAVSVVFLAITQMALPQDTPGRVASHEPEQTANKSGVSVWADLVAGIRLIRGYRTLTTLLIVVFVAELGFSGPMIAGVPLLASETGWGVRTIGWVLGGFGLGAAAAAGFLMWRKDLQRTGIAALSGLTAMGLSVVGLGLLPALGLPASTAFLIAGVLGLTSGIGAGFYGTLVSSAVLRLAPTGQIGRVMGALSFSSMAAVPITYALTGLLTETSNAQVPFLIGGALILLVAAAAFATPEVRRLAMDPADHGRSTPVRSSPSSESISGA